MGRTIEDKLILSIGQALLISNLVYLKALLGWL